ncbi:hypothetical protein BCON_0118g00010 [Botryotinia convoluta]|uniref:Uncharacterized protein n=1 Tax=Botryotinia convoluta TaxID=54673 RepID=A0A4Z1I305_9HELO|nr:hypothetical protein BCON_0118g00010 [Botryotinia convoluta]
MRTSRSSRHSGHTSRSTRGSGSGSSRTRRHNPPPPSSQFPISHPENIGPDVAVFFVYGLRRQDTLTPDKVCGRMATGGWEALTDLMNELIAINNYRYKPLNANLLRFRIRSSFEQRALKQLKMTSDLPIMPSRKWIRKEFLDIVLSYPTLVPNPLVIAAYISASTTPDMCWLWGGLEVQGIKEAAQAIKQHNDYKNGIRSSPPLPAERFLKGPNFVPANQSAWSLETYNAVRAQEPDHRPATQQQVGQSSSDYQVSSSVSQASAIQPYGTQQAGGFTGGYSQGYASEQQPAYPAAYPGQHSQY